MKIHFCNEIQEIIIAIDVLEQEQKNIIQERASIIENNINLNNEQSKIFNTLQREYASFEIVLNKLRKKL